MTKPTHDMCFVLMPFHPDFDNQWKLVIDPAIREAGLAPWRGDDEHLGTNIIMRDITKSISEARLIIADLTGRNPNVMYELGLAHAAKKPVIMVIQEGEDAPFDVNYVRYLKYDVEKLFKLKPDLVERIGSTLNMDAKDRPDLFPELKLFDKKEAEELAYLRKRAKRIRIEVTPPSADIFFNDRYIGQPPQEILVNPETGRNTLSAAAIGFYEYHAELFGEELEQSEIRIALEKRGDKAEFEKRVPRWLRYRRRDPNNPVLMRAIGLYLSNISDSDEALEEANELLQVAPDWFMAHNQAGYVKHETRPDEAKEHYEKVVSLRPDHFIGYYNLACSYALANAFDKGIEYLETIVDRDDLTESFRMHGLKMENDSDFDELKKSDKHAKRFAEIAGILNAGQGA
uniref:TPR repeat-containing protein n=1 Tax=Candidatus Kentrum eta TaxID=2126337 RepID=A0A450UQG6_9GAMM|nr:MAG: TPR repeat-containing protein [Candidatus Kentron sp. H]VFJ94781.1 MAG: TPR repeat-containing protein [Candidatus Kentron sp. H]VFK01275.1 MAG: TPR repeat-containing protein [Candidatus Kentron sp. H]